MSDDQNRRRHRRHRHPVLARPARRRSHPARAASEPDQLNTASPQPQRGPIAGSVPLLAALDPADAPVYPLLVTAALRHSQSAADPKSRLGWARYAHLGSYQLYGPFARATRHATSLYARALADHGRPVAAYRLHRHRLAVAHILGEPEELLAAHRLHAEARHAIGQCEQATAEIRHTLTWWHGYPSAPGEGTRILGSYAVILTGCGHHCAALRLLRTHPDLLPRTDNATTELAKRLTTGEQLHPQICRSQPGRQPPPATTAARHTAWYETLRDLPPAPALRQVRQAHQHGPGRP